MCISSFILCSSLCSNLCNLPYYFTTPCLCAEDPAPVSVLSSRCSGWFLSLPSPVPAAPHWCTLVLYACYHFFILTPFAVNTWHLCAFLTGVTSFSCYKGPLFFLPCLELCLSPWTCTATFPQARSSAGCFLLLPVLPHQVSGHWMFNLDMLNILKLA